MYFLVPKHVVREYYGDLPEAAPFLEDNEDVEDSTLWRCCQEFQLQRRWMRDSKKLAVAVQRRHKNLKRTGRLSRGGADADHDHDLQP